MKKQPPSPSKSLSLPCGRPRPDSARFKEDFSRGDWTEALAEYVGSRGLKQSETRKKIAGILLAQPSHFSIQDVIPKILAAHPTLGASTVYRTVNLLCDAGLLHETLVREGGETVYEIGNSIHHDHIVCLDCKQIFEFHESGIEKLQEKACASLSFRQKEHRHVIYAHCEYNKRSQAR